MMDCKCCRTWLIHDTMHLNSSKKASLFCSNSLFILKVSRNRYYDFIYRYAFHVLNISFGIIHYPADNEAAEFFRRIPLPADIIHFALTHISFE